MYELIKCKFQGANITVAVTGLPILISGEVIGGDDGIITLRMSDGKSIYLEASLIAFFY